MKTVFNLSILLATSLLSIEARNSLMSKNGQLLMDKKLNFWKEKAAGGELPRPNLASSFTPQICNNTADADGVVIINGEEFACRDVDFMSFIPLTDMFIDQQNGTTSSSDIWGWEDTVTGQEYTLFTVNNGIWFIDTIDPSNPITVAYGPNAASQDNWADVKVYKDVAYVVRDRTEETEFDERHGVEVFDLTSLRDIPKEDYPLEIEPDTIHSGHGAAHNIAMNTETGYAYTLGSTKCDGGPYILNLEPDKLNPDFEACFAEQGYTHDAQIVVYDGPDERFTGREIFLGFNEDHFVIIDVTDKQKIETISKTTYSNANYVHQGWLTADMRWVFLNDELDEILQVVPTTTTYLVDVTDLRNPIFKGEFVHRDISIDHNLYNWGAIHEKGWGGSPPYEEGKSLYPPISNRFMYLSNYVAGLRILDIQGIPEISEAGFFDVNPDVEPNAFEGTWSNYMHPSGNIAISSIERGLFMVKPRDKILYSEFVETESPVIVPTAPTPPTITPPTITPPPTLLPTAAPIVCEDAVPTGLKSTATMEDAECVDLQNDCSYDLVQEACPVTCGLCTPPTLAPTGIPSKDPIITSEDEEFEISVNNVLQLTIVVLLVIILVLGIKNLWTHTPKNEAGVIMKKESKETQLASELVAGQI
eukprot:snap_masked-scaffold_18-processed-gene-0.35-mRNA-1 protein AED:1.00 eAED:1.00 QI:0/-1/0/0/-1/1/1/0/645